jgi:WD40 repeat protein
MKNPINRFIIFLGMPALLLWGSLSGETTYSLRIQWEHRFAGLDVPEQQIFDSPIDLAAGPDGRIYVLDSRDSNIKLFTEKGEYLKTVSRKGEGPGELNRPWIASFVGDELFVVDSRNGRIQVFSPEGDYLRSYKVAADFGVGMAFAADGSLHINTRGFRSPHLIQVYDTQGERVQEIGEVEGKALEYFDFTAIKNDIKSGRIPASFRNDIHPAVAADGMIWAIYRGVPRLAKYSREGKLLLSRKIDVEHYDKIYQAFREENKKLEGKPSMFFPLRYVSDAAIGPHGNLYALLNTADRMTVLVFGGEGTLLKILEGPDDRISRIDFDREGRLYALGSESHYIYRFALDR